MMLSETRIYRLTYALALLIIALVLLSGYQKILYPGDFAVAVYRFHLLPGFLVNITALYIPWLEVVCAVSLLLIPGLRPAALRITLLLFVLFTIAVGVNLWRGSTFGCGCFGRGASENPISWIHLARNTGLVVLAAAALLARRKMEQKPQSPGRSD